MVRPTWSARIPARLISRMRPIMSFAAVAVSVMLREISTVAAPCCFTAAAIKPPIAPISVIVCSIRATAATEAPVAEDLFQVPRVLVRGAGGLRGERLHLRGHHREPLAGVTGPCRLNRRVERQKIGFARRSRRSCQPPP